MGICACNSLLGSGSLTDEDKQTTTGSRYHSVMPKNAMCVHEVHVYLCGLVANR